MLFPNKNVNYQESILSKFLIILKELRKSPLSVNVLYSKVNKDIDDINEFVSALDCLYALEKIEFDKEKGVLTYVS